MAGVQNEKTAREVTENLIIIMNNINITSVFGNLLGEYISQRRQATIGP